MTENKHWRAIAVAPWKLSEALETVGPAGVTKVYQRSS